MCVWVGECVGERGVGRCVFRNMVFFDRMGIGDSGMSGSNMVKCGAFIVLVCVWVDCGNVYVRGDEVIRIGLSVVLVSGGVSLGSVLSVSVVVSRRGGRDVVDVGERSPDGMKAAAAQFSGFWEWWVVDS